MIQLDQDPQKSLEALRESVVLPCFETGVLVYLMPFP